MNIQSRQQPFEGQCDEQELVREAVAGSTEAFTALYEIYTERVYRYVRSRLGDNQTAEDLTSQIFLNVWQKLGSYQPRGVPFRAWLFRIAHNALIDHYRSQRRVASLEEVERTYRPESINLDEMTCEMLEKKRIRQAMGFLTAEQQEVLRLKIIAGLNTDETARLMGKRPGAIRALQMRALQALKKMLELQND